MNTMVESGKASGYEEALKLAGQKDALKIYDPVMENTKKYQDIRGKMNRLYQKMY